METESEINCIKCSGEFEEGQNKEIQFHQKNDLIEQCQDIDGSINQMTGD